MQIYSHITSVIDDDGAVLLDLHAGRYFAINDVGSTIWRALEAGHNSVEIASTLCDEYDIDPQTARTDLSHFLSMLDRNGLIDSR